MMKYAILVFFILLFLPGFVLAIGISPSSVNIDFKPNLQYQNTFKIINNENKTMSVNLYSRGYLSEYVNLSSYSFSLAPFERRTFSYSLLLPKEVLPGRHDIRIGAVESIADLGGVAAVAGVEMVLFLNVPYPPRYAEAGMDVSKENESYLIAIYVSSLGNESIDASGSLAIYDYWNNTIKTSTYKKSIMAGTTENFYERLPAKDLRIGTYKAVAKFNYDGRTALAEKEFIVGEPSIGITKIEAGIIKQGDAGKIKIEIRNLYNGDIKNLYANVLIRDKILKSEKINLTALENKTIDIPIDTKGFYYGIYKTNVTVFYDGGILQKQIDVYILPKNIDFLLLSTSAAVILVIAAIAIYLFKRKR